jgi:hypothetical protein
MEAADQAARQADVERAKTQELMQKIAILLPHIGFNDKAFIEVNHTASLSRPS